MRIIIALDIIDGKCVRLSRGDFDTRKIYNEDPLEVAKQIEAAGLKYIHLVDLDGAKNRQITNINILEEISSGTDLVIDFGGGITTEQDIVSAFNAGAEQVTVGTVAVKQPSLFKEWLGIFGNERIILGADFRRRNIVSAAWMESSGKDIVSFISAYSSFGVKYAICTDAEKDGMMAGPSLDIYREIMEASGINLIASGGISSLKDIDELKAAGCEGAIVGKAVYEGTIKLTELCTIC